MKNLMHVLLLPFLFGCTTPMNSNVDIIPAEKIVWEKLNPARGDKSPQAGTVWGDRKGEVETAFLAKFVDGFSSPPHIHNVTYRGIVISGLVHNDDPKAANMWMPMGSYWTQPAGESHITSAKGKVNIAFIEIDKGPYLVKPKKMAFDNGERPYNIHASNIQWREQDGVEVVSVWKTGTLVKFKKDINIRSKKARIVVIAGSVKKDETLKPGSLVNLQDASVGFNCADECLLYVKSKHEFEIL